MITLLYCIISLYKYDFASFGGDPSLPEPPPDATLRASSLVWADDSPCRGLSERLSGFLAIWTELDLLLPTQSRALKRTWNPLERLSKLKCVCCSFMIDTVRTQSVM